VARRSIRETEQAIIVEGYMDVIQAHQAGFTNVVAQMGTSLTEQQLQQLAKYSNRLVLALDTDAAGIKATMRGLETAEKTLGEAELDAEGVMRQSGKLQVDIRVLEIPAGKDPDDFLRHAPDEWQQLVDHALPLPEYVIKVGMENLPANASIAEREILAHQLLPLLTATEDNVHSQTNVQLLSQKLRLDPRTMVEWASAKSNTRTRSPRPALTQTAPSTPTSNRPPVVSPRVSFSQQRREAERVVLAKLLQRPQRLYDANRLLRAIEQQDKTQLEAADFTQTDFRSIFVLFCDACNQDDAEIDEYVLHYLDDSLRDTLEDILAEPMDAFARKVSRLHATELVSIQKDARHGLVPVEDRDEFPGLLIKMRRERLQAQQREIYFLQMEAAETGDDHLELQYGQDLQHLLRRLRALDDALSGRVEYTEPLTERGR
jgi:DNA primase